MKFVVIASKSRTTLPHACLIAFCMLYSIGVVAAQEKSNVVSFAPVFSLGLGVEVNENSRRDTALGGMFQMDYRFKRSFALGIKGVVSMNSVTEKNKIKKNNSIKGVASSVSEVADIDVDAFFRWYPFMFDLRRSEIAVFAQADGGIALVWENKTIDPSLGITAGIRFTTPIKLYIEPYGQFGYPNTWTTGIALGYSFVKKPPRVSTTVVNVYVLPNPPPVAQPVPQFAPPAVVYPQPATPPAVRGYPAPVVRPAPQYAPPPGYVYPYQPAMPPAVRGYPAPVVRPVPQFAPLPGYVYLVPIATPPAAVCPPPGYGQPVPIATPPVTVYLPPVRYPY
jgi:hypothetical protein